MTRNSGVLIRQLFIHRSNPSAGLVHHHRKLSCKSIQTLTSIPSSPHTIDIPSTPKPLSYSLHFPNLHFLQHRRRLSSATATATATASASASATATASFSASASASCILFSSPSNMFVIWEKDELKRAMKEVKDGLLPAVFYFTDHMCPPDIQVASPAIRKLREQFPHVTIYKIINHPRTDIGDILENLSVSSMPTFHFYQNGKMVDEICGAYVDRLIDTFQKLYRYVIPVETIQRTSTSRKGKRTTQQFVMQAKKDENGSKGVVGEWKVEGAATSSQRRGAATLSLWSGAAKLSQLNGHVAGESRSTAPSLHEVMRDVESLPMGYSDGKLWWFAKGLFKSQHEKRVIFSNVTEPYFKLAWLLDEMAEE